MADRTREHRGGSLTIYTDDMGSIGGLDPQDVPMMLEAIADVRRLGPCLKCGHLACPCCLGNANWCDQVGEDGALCCDGECTHAPQECKRCGFVVCACPAPAAPSVLDKVCTAENIDPRLRVPNPDDAPPFGYTPLSFMPGEVGPQGEICMRMSPQISLRGPYLLQLTARDRAGELMAVLLEHFEIDCQYLKAAVGGASEAPDQSSDGAPNPKQCIPLDGPILRSSGYAQLRVRNPHAFGGTVIATLYGRDMRRGAPL